MSDAIVTFFVCLVLYRCACAVFSWHPIPLVSITINNRTCDDD